MVTVLPHGRAVKVNHHPFGWVKGERLRMFDAIHHVTIFRADEGGAGIGSVDVQPDVLVLTCRKQGHGSVIYFRFTTD